MDITEVILHQHAEQRRMFAMLDEVPRTDKDTLTVLWRRLEVLLETHAEAEEKFVYPRLLQVGRGASDADDAAEEVEDALKDHNDIRAAIRKVAEHEPGTDDWWDAVTECRVSNSDHMAEEERQDLADLRRHAGLDERHEIALKFLAYESDNAATGIEPQDKDPDAYLGENAPTSSGR